MDTLKKVLDDLGMSASAQKVYISLITHGEGTAHTLAKRVGITRPSVYDQIKELRAKDLVAERAEGGTTFFVASDVRRLDAMLAERIDSFTSDRKVLTKTLASLLNETHAVQPKIRFFEGKEGVQQMMKDILWYDDISLSIFWPYQQMRDILGDEFLQWFNERRVKRHISLRTIWPAKEKSTKNHIFAGNDAYVARRYMRTNHAQDMGYLVYEDKTVFISSTKESFGFIIESKEFAALTTMQFELLWKDAVTASK